MPAHGHELSLPLLSFQRTLSGSSQARGQLSLVLRNRAPVSQDVLYLETMPWLIQFFLHTLHTRVNGMTAGTDPKQYLMTNTS